MKIDKRSRSELKSYFVKNSIPTESNFADLIDGMLNQNDDGMVKLPGEPLSIQATGDDTSQKKVINFYDDFKAAKPAWTLSLKPRTEPGDPATAKAGWNLSDGDGNNRLFIDYNSGNVGIGGLTPRTRLDVNGEVVAVNRLTLAQDTGIETKTWHVDNYRGLFRLSWQPNIKTVGTPAVVATTDGNVGIGMTNPQRKLQIGDDVVGLSFDPGTSPNAGVLRFGDHTGWKLHFGRSREASRGGLNSGTSGLLMTIQDSGEVGIGTTAPQDSLDVAGGVRILTGSNPIRFTSGWSGFSFVDKKDAATGFKNRGEISNDTNTYKTLMIVGNASAGTLHPNSDYLQRRVGVWDRLDVFGELVQHAPMIKCNGRGDWDSSDHPLQTYLRDNLKGQKPGTMLCVMGDQWRTEPHFWIGCVCADEKAYITYLRPWGGDNNVNAQGNRKALW